MRMIQVNLFFFIMQLYVIVGSVETLTNDSAGNTILSVRKIHPVIHLEKPQK